MSVKLAVQGKTLAILEREAATLKAPPTVVARAIIDTVIREGITQEVLAGVELESYLNRRRGQRQGKHLFQGKLRTMTWIAEKTGVPVGVIYQRLQRGWTLEKAATVPKMPKGFPKREAVQ